jgi:hypothetical protein
VLLSRAVGERVWISERNVGEMVQSLKLNNLLLNVALRERLIGTIIIVISEVRESYHQ